MAKVSAAKLQKWGLASSDKCAYGMVQSHTADKCLGSKLHDSGLQRLYSADDIAINWFEGMAMKAFMK